MSIHLFESKTVKENALRAAVELALRAYKPHTGVVSLRRIISTVRMNQPDCTLSDKTLNAFIGDLAIMRGYNVHFDARP